MQMICADANCGMTMEVSVGVPLSFICSKCGQTQVVFDQPVSILDPADKRAIGRLRAGKPINAEDLRDIRTSPWRRSFILELVTVMEPPETKVEVRPMPKEIDVDEAEEVEVVDIQTDEPPEEIPVPTQGRSRKLRRTM